jgi:hypothetical protein
MTKLSKRNAANMMARRQGIPQTQAGIDAMHADLVAKLNATLPASQETPIEAARASSTIGGAKPIQAKVDWGSIADTLNREAGLKTPTRIHGRHG